MPFGIRRFRNVLYVPLIHFANRHFFPIVGIRPIVTGWELLFGHLTTNGTNIYLIWMLKYHGSVLRIALHESGYFDLCWLLGIRCYYPKGLPRPHGISHTSFIVYLPNLRIKVTVAFGSFAVCSQLVRLICLCIRFLFVRPRVRYCFFSPERHRSKLASRYGVRRQLRPLWTFTTDVWHARHTKKVGIFAVPTSVNSQFVNQ